GIVIAAVAAFVAIVVVGVAGAVGLLLGPGPEPEPVAAPGPTAVPSAPADEPDADPDDPAAPPSDSAGSDIEQRLAAKIDEYKRLRDSGALWQSIPDTDFNRTAVSAFLYFLTDMKVATI